MYMYVYIYTYMYAYINLSEDLLKEDIIRGNKSRLSIKYIS